MVEAMAQSQVSNEEQLNRRIEEMLQEAHIIRAKMKEDDVAIARLKAETQEMRAVWVRGEMKNRPHEDIYSMIQSFDTLFPSPLFKGR